MGSSTRRAVDDANMQKREEQILELLTDAHPPQSNTILETGTRNVRPMPPAFLSSPHSSPSVHSHEPTPGPSPNPGNDMPRAEVAIMTPRNVLPHDYSVREPLSTRMQDQKSSLNVMEALSEQGRIFLVANGG